MPVGDEWKDKRNAGIKAGFIWAEVETAAWDTVSQILGLKAGAVLHVVWNQEREKRGLKQDEKHNTGSAIETAIKAIEIDIRKKR